MRLVRLRAGLLLLLIVACIGMLALYNIHVQRASVGSTALSSFSVAAPSLSTNLSWLRFVLADLHTGIPAKQLSSACAEVDGSWAVCSQQQLATAWLLGYEHCARGIVQDPHQSPGLDTTFFAALPNHGRCSGHPLGTSPRPLHQGREWHNEVAGFFCCEPESSHLGCQGSNGGQSEELTLVMLQAVFGVLKAQGLKFWARGSTVLGVLREQSLVPNCVEVVSPIEEHSTPDVDIAVADVQQWDNMSKALAASLESKGFYVGAQGGPITHVWYPVSQKCRDYMIASQGAAPESLAAALADWGEWNVCFHLHIHHPNDGWHNVQDRKDHTVNCHYKKLRQQHITIGHINASLPFPRHAGHYLSTLWGDWTVPTDAKYGDAIPSNSYQSGDAEAYQCTLLPRGAELQAAGKCIEWFDSRWRQTRCGDSQKWVFGTAATVKVLAQHISNTEGQCFERKAHGLVVLAVCCSSSQEQKWVHVMNCSTAVGALEEECGGMLQAGGSSNTCLSITALGSKSQLVMEECSDFKASHLWKWNSTFE